ncbi:class I SAM-dependent methyltransferase [Amycolatopsis sp. FDAARGOS 1241]|uniref:class I SAM-dependent DNA methyltransferase n=1 Tax=Amycolatopsis sp. FDAARGOS 1241 TaxID=2778070 RepID=UPI00195263B8|nr:class I SAM-dependent methyltransferase [Amycolatopsis sp. FDAARGOS 1241]QRP44945.1 class I SAM-dependent methyltransferase [Amycolatopsis sp. FDAARGOS 1241]
MKPWLASTRTSYDTVAAAYAGQLRDRLDDEPYLRAVLGLFAELAGSGPVADIGCGPGWVTAHLHGLGVDAFGIDLSPEMIAYARRAQPGVRFEVGSMTDLTLRAASVSGVLAFWSMIHVPDCAVPGVLAGFRRVLRPRGVVPIGFHVGTETTLKTSGYGGHPMHVHIHRRTPAVVSALLRDAGFTIEAEILLNPDDRVPGGVVIARAPAAD